MRAASIRVGEGSTGTIRERAVEWRHRNSGAFDRLCTELSGSGAVVNAAGLARPTSTDSAALLTANAVQPVVVALACRAAGVPRLVHVSTAAVQGRRDPLDESPASAPFSPYTRSKAAAERFLLGCSPDLPEEVVVYRPPSVHGFGRPVTRKLARFAAAPLLPLCGDGSQPVPVALVENVADGIVFAATSPSIPPVVLQPSEGLTARSLLAVFGNGRLLPMPPVVVEAGLRAVRRPADQVAALSSRLRWLELLWQGQSQRADALPAAGFVAPVGREGWLALARHTKPAKVGCAS